MEFEIREIERESIKVLSILLVIAIIVSFIFHSISFLLGLLLGYIINLIVFRIIQVETDATLAIGGKYSAGLILLIGLAKLALRALGFIVAIKFPMIFHIISVFVGYFVIKLTIFYLGYRMRKE